jgi:hypothetical protein
MIFFIIVIFFNGPRLDVLASSPRYPVVVYIIFIIVVVIIIIYGPRLDLLAPRTR